MDDWTCHLRQCANILRRTNSRRMLFKVTPTATCFNGTPTFGKHGLTLTDKISKKIGTRKGMGRGMGSPIPSVQEGAWVREDPKVVGGGQLSLSVDPFDLEP